MWIAEHSPGYQYGILPLAFFVTAIIRTAQGSATVAMITAVGMLTVFNTEGDLLTLMGFAGLIATMVMAMLFPMT
jgi:H+/gluconate symporter-like permease